MRFNFASALLGAIVSAGDVTDYANLTTQVELKNVKSWLGPMQPTPIDPNKAGEVINDLQAGGSTAWQMEGDGDNASLVTFITQSVVNTKEGGKLDLPDDSIVRVGMCTPDETEGTVWCSLVIFEKTKVVW